jgi:hypothetical protein
MGWQLPPLNALRAFEAAGRLSSFTLAAEELHVTPGAVSRQIKLLEETLGIPLFIRNNREMRRGDRQPARCAPRPAAAHVLGQCRDALAVSALASIPYALPEPPGPIDDVTDDGLDRLRFRHDRYPDQDRLPVGGRAFEDGAPRRDHPGRIDIDRLRHLGPRDLKLLNMHDITPDQQRRIA